MPVNNTVRSVGMLRDGDSYRFLTNREVQKPIFKTLVFNDSAVSFEEPLGNQLNFTILPSGLVYMSGLVQTSPSPTSGLEIVGTIPELYRPRRALALVKYGVAAGNIQHAFTVFITQEGSLTMGVDAGGTPPVSTKIDFEGTMYIPSYTNTV